MAKKQASSGRGTRTSSRGRADQRGRRSGGAGRKLGIPLAPVLRILDVSIDRLNRQLPKFADDPTKTNALQQSIERLTSVRHLTQEICPNEGRWFGVPTGRDHYPPKGE